MLTVREKLVRVAASQVGYVATSTSGKFCDWYGLQGYWCAMFVSWCANEVGIMGTLVPRHAYTPSGASWFRHQGRWGAGTRGIRRGDIVYFNFGGYRIDHVGIFYGWTRDGRVVTIDGNTGRANGRTGGTVAYATRSPRYVVGHGKLGPAGDQPTGKQEQTQPQKVRVVRSVLEDDLTPDQDKKLTAIFDTLTSGREGVKYHGEIWADLKETRKQLTALQADIVRLKDDAARVRAEVCDCDALRDPAARGLAAWARRVARWVEPAPGTDETEPASVWNRWQPWRNHPALKQDKKEN